MSAAYSQINLSGFWSSTPRTGYGVPTYIDSLCIDTKVANGLAVTRVTMTVTPGGYVPYSYYAASSPSTETPLDSIEMRLSFMLPTDFVADSMWLWVDGVPQEAYIQDRNLAESQYLQIVKRRRDPALLQYSGNGYYSLCIFPASSYAGRKIALQFNHTFDEDSAQTDNNSPLLSSALPFTFDTANQYYYSYAGIKRPIAYARLSCQTLDRKRYAVALPGLGSGTFSHGSPCTMTCRDLCKLRCGAVSCSDPSGSDEYLWAGRDLRSDRTCAGFSTPLRQQELSFQPEPDVLIIVLDVRASSWNWNDYYRLQAKALGQTYNLQYYSSYTASVDMWERAQKYALLAVKSYVNEGQVFNVVFSGTNPRSVFRSPVRGTDANKQSAIDAILKTVPDAAANTLAALRNAAAQADNGIVFLISDLYQPYDYYASGTYYLPSAAGIAYDSMLARIGTLFKNTPGPTLFTISDDWKLNCIPGPTGGYRIGGLRYAFTLPCTTKVIDGKQVLDLYLPALFGSSNPNGLSSIKVSSRDLDDIVFTLDRYYWSYYYVDMGVRTVPLTSASSMPAANAVATATVPPVTSRTIAFLRVAGRTSKHEIHKPVQCTLAGKLGGLCFTREITAAADHKCHDAATMQDVQWAFRKTEWLYADSWLANAGAIKQIGREYHIVTRQTSLLALEPGMDLWQDTLSSGTGQTTTANPSAPLRTESASMMAVPTSGTSGGALFVFDAVNGYGTTGNSGIIDSIPAEKLMEGYTALSADDSRSPLATALKTGIVSIKGSCITLQLPAAGGMINFALYDLNGRRLASQTIDASRSADGRIIWNLNNGQVLAKGNYMLRVTGSGYDRMFRIPFIGR